LTGDKQIARACVVDACAIATTQNEVFEQWLEPWARRSIIRSAVEMQHAAIVRLSGAYERKPCPHQPHESLTPEKRNLLERHSEDLMHRADVLCRAALVVRGIESYSSAESALMLGVTRPTLEASYCAGLCRLETLGCGILCEFGGCPAVPLNQSNVAN
jgi:DNA-directed RNA polymerase specialized sigma24 family protein